MAQKKNYELMAEYILPRLEAGGQKFEPGQNNVEGIGKVNFLKHENKRIFLIDRPYTEDEYKLLLNIASGRTSYNNQRVNYEHASIFFKDGIIGFRPGIMDIKYKQQKNFSLKNYSDDEVKRMMQLYPRESVELNRNNFILYFQPESQRLEEALVKYRLIPVRYDYSHIDENEIVMTKYGPRKRFKPQNHDAEKLYINELVEQLSDSIILDKGQIRNSDKPKDIPSQSTQPRLF